MDIHELERLESHFEGYEINENFPPKLPLQFQHLMDCRLQLILKHNEIILPGDTKIMETTCTVAPHSGWILSTKPNPSLDLALHEQYIRPCSESTRVTVTITNTTTVTKNLPSGLCIAYLILN